MTICWWIILASWLCLPRYVYSDSDEHPAVTCTVVSPNLSLIIIIIINDCFAVRPVLPSARCVTAANAVSRNVSTCDHHGISLQNTINFNIISFQCVLYVLLIIRFITLITNYYFFCSLSGFPGNMPHVCNVLCRLQFIPFCIICNIHPTLNIICSVFRYLYICFFSQLYSASCYYQSFIYQLMRNRVALKEY